MKRQIARLVEHMVWADLRTLASLRATPVADGLRLAAHLVTTESLYLERIRGKDPWPQDFWPDLTLGECDELAARTHEAYRSLADRLDEHGLRATVRYRTSRGSVEESEIGDMLLHLALHGEHHRGQIARLVREAGGVPGPTDFIVWTREATTPAPKPPRPDSRAAAWPSGPPQVGATARRSRTVTARDIELFTAISGDRNPIHYDEELARSTRFGGVVVQGGVTTAILNAVVAEDLPGPGTVFLQTDWRFVAPVRPGDEITGEVSILHVRTDKPITRLDTRVLLRDGTIVLEGTAVCYTMPLDG